MRTETGVLHSRQWYTAFGEQRYQSGTLPTDRRYTGQLEIENDLYHYGARVYDPVLGRFIQADTIIPEPGSPMDWDRYVYVNNNPVKYSDPTGHAYCQSKSPGAACMNDNPDPVPNPQETTPDTTDSTAPVVLQTQACSGSNVSVLCIGPAAASGQVTTNVEYPIYQQLDNYDGPYGDEGCNGTWLCLIPLLADAANYIHTQTNWPAHFSNQYVVATISYEVHQNSYGPYTIFTSMTVTNHTNSPLAVNQVNIGASNAHPTIPIPAGQSTYFPLTPTSWVPGGSNSVSIFFRSEVFQPIRLNTQYP